MGRCIAHNVPALHLRRDVSIRAYSSCSHERTLTTLYPSSSAKRRSIAVLPDPRAPLISTDSCSILANDDLKHETSKSCSRAVFFLLNGSGGEPCIGDEHKSSHAIATPLTQALPRLVEMSSHHSPLFQTREHHFRIAVLAGVNPTSQLPCPGFRRCRRSEILFERNERFV